MLFILMFLFFMNIYTYNDLNYVNIYIYTNDLYDIFHELVIVLICIFVGIFYFIIMLGKEVFYVGIRRRFYMEENVVIQLVQ
jgi:hypothetical protein